VEPQLQTGNNARHDLNGFWNCNFSIRNSNQYHFTLEHRFGQDQHADGLFKLGKRLKCPPYWRTV